MQAERLPPALILHICEKTTGKEHEVATR